METINSYNFVALACAFFIGAIVGWYLYQLAKDLIK